MAQATRLILSPDSLPLPWPQWQETAETLHLWTQVIGKIRLDLATRTNHWWHVALYPTTHGLTTSPMPYGNRMLQIDFDFLRHRLTLQTSDGMLESFTLKPMSVKDFHAQVMARLSHMKMHVNLHTTPSEIPNPIPFEQDVQHRAYDPDAATRFWQILLHTERVFTRFRARFLGKVSPVHFFWGGFDLAQTRFSGRRAPLHPPVPNTPLRVVQTAYSHEVSSYGFWPGGPALPEPVYYAYAYPTPPGYREYPVQPAEAYFHDTLGEFILPYEAVRQAKDPDQHLLTFLQTTYEAAATLAHWNRTDLEPASLEI